MDRARPPPPGAEDTRLQHIALATDDIVGAARRIRERGTALLPIPVNYYDDLDARYELEPQNLATLAELGILYDRDENGEFFHCYTATVGRVFFELVQRTLRAYGARLELVDRPAAEGGWQAAWLARLRALLSTLPDAYWPDQYNNPDNIVGYASLAAELAAQWTTSTCWCAASAPEVTAPVWSDRCGGTGPGSG